MQDCYVDDILTSNNNLETQRPNSNNGVEKILKAGGFSLKPLVLTGQSGRQSEATDSEGGSTEPRTLILPKQMRDEESKALAVGYEPEFDKLCSQRGKGR